MKKLLLLLILSLTLGVNSLAASRFYSTDGKRRVLVEAFTADWCGFCPRLHAMVQYYQNNHGDDILPLYYIHKQGSQSFGVEVANFYNISAFPTVNFDRSESSFVPIEKSKIDSIYNNVIKPVATKPGLDFKAGVKLVNNAMVFNAIFDEGIEAMNYKIHYIVVADGVTLKLVNFYSGKASEYSDYVPEMEIYFKKPYTFTEKLNHVAITCSNLAGDTIDKSNMTATVELTDVDENITSYHGVIVVTDSDNHVINALSVPVTNESISIDNLPQKQIFIGDTFKLSVNSNPAELVDNELIWSSDNEDVIGVDSTGLVTAKGEGEATVTVALASDPEISDSVHLVVETPRASSIAFSPENIAVTQGEKIQLYLYGEGPENWKDFDTIVYSSSDETVATVDQSGIVTGINPGNVQITAQSDRYPELSAVANVTVNERVSDFKVTITEKTAYRTAVYWLPIELTNDAPLLGLQCDVWIPAGCEFAVNDENYSVAVNKERALTHNAVSRVMENGDLRIICTSSTNELIYNGSGALLYVPVRISADAPEKLTFAVSEIVVSTAESVAEKIKGFEAVSPVEDMVIGDLDGDGEINVADVTGTITVILNKEHYNLTAEAADFNNDGVVDIMDIVNLVDAILNPSAAKRRVARENESEDPQPASLSALRILEESYERGKRSTLSIALDEPQQYIAAQFDIVLPEHTHFTATTGNINISLDPAIASTHTISADLVYDNICRVIIYSLGNTAFNAAPKLVNVEVAFDSDVENTAVFGIENIRLVTKDRNPINLDNANFTLINKNSSVDEISGDAKVRISRIPGAVRVDGVTEGKTVALYSAAGTLISITTAGADGCVVELPYKGVCILRAGDAVFKIMAD